MNCIKSTKGPNKRYSTVFNEGNEAVSRFRSVPCTHRHLCIGFCGQGFFPPFRISGVTTWIVQSLAVNRRSDVLEELLNDSVKHNPLH